MKSEFEKYAQQKIDNHPTEVDVEALWAAVEPQVRPKKRKRRFFWIFFFGLGFSVIGASCLVWSFLSKNEDTSLKDATISMTNTEYPETEICEEYFDKNTTKNEMKNNPKSNAATSVSETTKSEGDKSRKQANIEKHNSNNEAIFSQKSNTNNFLTPSKINDNASTSENNISVKSLTKLEAVATLNIDFLPILDLDLFKKESEITAKEMKLPIKERKADKEKKWAIGIHAGWSPNLLNLDTIEAPQNDYLSVRKNSETPLETIHLGIDISRKLGKRFYLKSGAIYSRNTRKFFTQNSSVQIDTFPDVLLNIFINTTTNDTIFENGELLLFNSKIEQVTRYNRIQSFDIPIQIGYEIEKFPWAFGAEAGVLINILTKRKGTIFDEQGDFYDLKKDSNEWFRNNAGLGLIVSLKTAYAINKKWKISVLPTFRFGGHTNREIAPVRERYKGFGINLGISHSF